MELPRVARRPAPATLLVVAAIGAVLTTVCIAVVDQPLARWIATFEPAAVWTDGIELLEWAIGLPIFRWLSAIVLVLGMIVAVLVPRLRYQAPAWMFLAASHLLAQLATRYGKEWTERIRPLPWIKGGGGDTFFRDGGAAFPSGHVAIFASLVIPLVVVFPRLRPLLLVIAYVMLARLAVDAHWLSDVIGGVTLVALVTWVCGLAIRPCPPR